jgi:hypothetical protein
LAYTENHNYCLDAYENYFFYVFFWSDENGSPWCIRAAFTQAGLAHNLFIGGASPSGPTTPIQVGLDDAGRILWAARIGYISGVTEQEILTISPAITAASAPSSTATDTNRLF